MTKEQAIICLKGIKNYGRDTFTEQSDWQNSLDIAIKALEQQTCDDCVSRADVMVLISHTNAKHFSFTEETRGISIEAFEDLMDGTQALPPVIPTQCWIPVSERLPETDNENNINNYNVLLWVKNKSHPEREPQIYLGKLRHIDGDDGSGNFWGIETKPCDWTIWGWSYFNEPEVIAWQPLPQAYEDKRGNENDIHRKESI